MGDRSDVRLRPNGCLSFCVCCWFFPKLFSFVPQVGVGSFLFYDLPKPFRFEWWSYLRFTLVWTLCGYECGGTFILAPSETPSKCSGYLGQHPFRWWSFFLREREEALKQKSPTQTNCTGEHQLERRRRSSIFMALTVILLGPKWADMIKWGRKRDTT